ncbi:MAG: ATP-binding cassette domain-containing protein, partial [Pirellulales bacterium]|nr:ATP-binding cassette domain-containing protein [Pirellulales bacterium]
PNAEDRQAAWEALEKLGLHQLADRHIRQLSGGQQQRVFLARALCQQADIYLLDEPLTGVDAGTEETIFSLIDQLKKETKTILLVSHDLSILTRLDQIMLLDRRIVAMGPPQQVATEENLRKTYGGRLSLLDEAEAELMRMK